MEEKTYYVVSTVITGTRSTIRSTVNMAGTVKATKKPETKYRSTNLADYYLDYFNTLEEAEKFCNENQ